MSDETDYQIIETDESDKHSVKIRTYVTGADEEAITKATTDGMQVTVEDAGKGAATNTKVDAGIQLKVDRVKVGRFVVSVDGDERGCVEKVYALRKIAFHQVLDAINEVTKEVVTTESDTKKKSSTA